VAPLGAAHLAVTERAPLVRGHRPLLAWYADDVTGSTDALEVLGAAGIPSALFLAPPSPERVAGAFADRQAIGVAGIARSLPTDEIGAEIEPILRSLRALDPALVHYKICSTFDSSPEVGSIGAAIDVAWPVFEPDWVPVLVAAPALGRYTVFGTHFATFSGDVFRLDRHPVMSRHPVTPMHEADLRRHLGGQTDRDVGLVDLLALRAPDQAGTGTARLDAEIAAGRRVIVLDGLDQDSMRAAAALVWDRRPAARPGLVVGSSGVESGLVDVWRRAGLLRGASPTAALPPPPTGPVLALSGSASEWTRRQIAAAVDAGWSPLALDTERLLPDATGAVDGLVADARPLVDAGRNLVVHAALGPDDERIERTRGAAAERGLTDRALGRLLGDALGSAAAQIVASGAVRRVLIAGGDASGRAARTLGVEALDYVASLDPGVPLCRATGPGPVDGLEIVMKSGQLGSEDLLVRLSR
jgi:3-oxoisoapionate kinase